jgi:hypothetical protein
MLIMDLKKMQNLDEMSIRRFIKAATELVMDEVTNTDEENKQKIIMFTARDMAIGAAMRRNEHILTGVGIGVLGTTLAFTIGNKIKKKKDEVIVQFDKDGLDKMEEILKEQKDTFKETSASQSEVTEDEQVDEEKSIMDRVNDILKKPSNLEDLKAVIKELRQSEKK